MKKIFLKDVKLSVFICIALCFYLIFLFIPNKVFNNISFLNQNSFISSVESKTFDIRQKMLSRFRSVSDKIVVISLDNQSFEYMTEHFGTWPMPRRVYSDMVEYVEKQKPKLFAIDILFVGAWNNEPQDDKKLAEMFSKYDNLFTGIYFDDYPIEKKNPVNIPDKHSSAILSSSDSFLPYHAGNFRRSYPEMLAQGNLGATNLNDYEDRIVRAIPMFVSYPVYDEQLRSVGIKYYPNLSLKIVSKYFGYDDKKFVIDKNNNLILNDLVIPMNEKSEVFLNWYDKKLSNIDNNYNSFFKTVPFKDLFVSMENEKNGKSPILDSQIFKDKIVLFGFTAESLFDLKSTPVEKYLPGVELYGIFANNAIDNSFIKKIGLKGTINIAILLFIFSFLSFYNIKQLYKSNSFLVLSIFLYIILSYTTMFFNNLWLPVVLPLTAIFAGYLFSLLVNYFMKSKDYDKLYKLVNIDDLTGLYNKRFFSKHLELNIEYSKIYNRIFSLIMVDIDHFKKFNDTYGHLSGDCVLKQVSKILSDTVAQNGAVCRYGGEEICVLLPQTDYEQAYSTAVQLCNNVANADFVLADNSLTKVTISLGVATFPQNAQNGQKLIEYADKALYYAKEHGRNQVGKHED